MKNLFTLALACAVAISTSAAPAKPVQKTLRGIAPAKTELQARAAEKAPAARGEKKHVKVAKPSGAAALTAARKAPAKAPGDMELLFDEPFACLTEGSEAAPVAIELDDNSNIPEDIIGEANYGFGGAELYQAGGALFIAFADEEGFGWTPDVPEGSLINVSVDVKVTGDVISDEFDIFLVDYGAGAVDAGYEFITNEWKTLTFSLDATGASYYGVYYLQFYAFAEADIMVKNFKIYAEEPRVKAPVALNYTDYTGTSFTANWTEVENATSYLLTVAEYDYDTEEILEPYLYDAEPVEGTSFVVDDIIPGALYYYAVQATDGEYVSSFSNGILVAALTVPTNISGTVDESTIKASWDETPGANYYVATVLEQYSPKADETFVLADADLSHYSSVGTLDAPEECEDLYEEWPELPGWTVTLPAYVDGALGFADFWIYQIFGFYAGIESGVIDFSGITEGTPVDFSFKACSSENSRLSVGMFVYDAASDEYLLGDYYTSDPVGRDITEINFSLNTKPAPTIILIQALNDDAEIDPNMFFASIKASIDMTAGQTIGTTFASVETETNGFELTDVAVKADAAYTMNVTAYKVDLEYGDVVAQSAASDYVPLTNLSGIEAVAAAGSQAPARYFNLQGIEVANPANGLFIEMRGTTATKVVK